jgi:hypothetical protein
MSQSTSTVAAIVASLLIAVGWWIVRNRFGISSIEYLGQVFRLRRTYLTYEGYRNDPNNLPPEERRQIESLLVGYVVGPMFRDESDFGQKVGVLKFPGYGMAGLSVESGNRAFRLAAVEVPGTDKWRYLLAAAASNGFQLVDDFTISDRIVRAVYANNVVSYRSSTKTVREQTI